LFVATPIAFLGREHGPVLGLEHEPVGGRPFPRAPPSVKRRAFTAGVDVERRLLVRMRRPQRLHDLVLAVGRIHRLEPQLRNALAAPLADRRIRALAAEEGPGALRVPRAPLVVADAPRAGLEQRIPHRIE
jgi:hypothetical protein